MKRYHFKLKGWQEDFYEWGRTRSEARYNLWLRYSDPWPCTFGQFVKEICN